MKDILRILKLINNIKLFFYLFQHYSIQFRFDQKNLHFQVYILHLHHYLTIQIIQSIPHQINYSKKKIIHNKF